MASLSLPLANVWYLLQEVLGGWARPDVGTRTRTCRRRVASALAVAKRILRIVQHAADSFDMSLQLSYSTSTANITSDTMVAISKILPLAFALAAPARAKDSYK